MTHAASDPDVTRAWGTVAVSWLGTGAAYAMDHMTHIAAAVSIAYTLWQWWRQYSRDKTDRRVQRKLLRRLGLGETEPDDLYTRPPA